MSEAELAIKMDHDPDVPSTIEDEIEIARQYLSKRNLDENLHIYWKGVLDGLEAAYKLMQKKDG